MKQYESKLINKQDKASPFLSLDEKRECINKALTILCISQEIDSLNQKIYRQKYFTESECINGTIELYSIYFYGK